MFVAIATVASVPPVAAIAPIAYIMFIIVVVGVLTVNLGEFLEMILIAIPCSNITHRTAFAETHSVAHRIWRNLITTRKTCTALHVKTSVRDYCCIGSQIGHYNTKNNKRDRQTLHSCELANVRLVGGGRKLPG